ncbi:MAG: hypothetical protein ACI857_002837 [Arenicella sp.]|jgi:hypothetical protein
MKSIFILIISFTALLGYSQETRQVNLRCDVLGAKKGSVRYYHPIEGEYQVKLKNYYLPSQKEEKELGKFILIEPLKYLQDSLTYVQANSLRHKIDLDQLVYVNWAFGYDTLNNQAKLDSVRNAACYVRDKEYSGLVNHYFQPFMMSRYEITNQEYREFIDWVKDSIFREKIYLNTDPTGNDEISEEQIAEMLDYKDVYYDEEELEWVEFDPSDPEKNREMFHFNYDFDWRKEIMDSQVIPLLSDMYLRPNERWYKRRELNVTKLIYSYVTINEVQSGMRFVEEHEVNVYSDTASWEDNKFGAQNPMHNMYFWHPAFDNYPVVGLSFVQVQAYIHWKQERLAEKHPQLMSIYELGLPNLQEIEWTVNSSAQNYAAKVISDNQIITDLLFGLKDDEDGKFADLFRNGQMPYTEKVSVPKDASKEHKKIWFIPGKNDYGYENMAQLYEMRATQNVLKNKVEFLSNNVSEWVDMDYEKYDDLLDAYTNYNCFADIDYCQYQRPLDAAKLAKNDKDGKLIMGSNWYDERYENALGVNTGGIYPKRFADKDSSYATVGFRLVLRLKKV